MNLTGVKEENNKIEHKQSQQQDVERFDFNVFMLFYDDYVI